MATFYIEFSNLKRFNYLLTDAALYDILFERFESNVMNLNGRVTIFRHRLNWILLVIVCTHDVSTIVVEYHDLHELSEMGMNDQNSNCF